MVSTLPTLPPAFLEQCLALSKHLSAMKTCTAKIEVSPSHFVFSVNHFPGNKEPGLMRKKTPSDLRRSALRKAEHLKRKNFSQTTTNPATSTVKPLPTSSPDEISPEVSSEPTEEEESPSSNTSSTPSVETPDLSKVPVMKESPLDNIEIVETMDTTVPVTTATRDNTNDTASVPMMSPEMSVEKGPTQQFDIPPIITPISSPERIVTEPEEQEIRVLICALNQATALKKSKNLPNSKFLGPHPSNKKHHFFFTTTIESQNLPGLKEAVPNLGEDFLLLRVVSENKNYAPDQQIHCQACRVQHHKK